MSVHAGPVNTPKKLFLNGEKGGWWDPSDRSTLFADTGATTPAQVDGIVRLMRDKSGNGWNMTQTSSDTRAPILRYNGRTGSHYLEFDGTDDGMSAPSLPGLPGAATGIAITLGVSYQRKTAGTDSGTILGTDAIGNYGNVWSFGARISGPRFYSVVRNIENTAWLTLWDCSVAALSAIKDIDTVYTLQGNIGESNATLTDHLNGAFRGTATSNLDNLTYWPKPMVSTISIGARSAYNDNYMHCYFYGGYMVIRAITTEERMNTEYYLKSKHTLR